MVSNKKENNKHTINNYENYNVTHIFGEKDIKDILKEIVLKKVNEIH